MGAYQAECIVIVVISYLCLPAGMPDDFLGLYSQGLSTRLECEHWQYKLINRPHAAPFCHAERSEGTVTAKTQMLRYAQHDTAVCFFEFNLLPLSLHETPPILCIHYDQPQKNSAIYWCHK